MRPLGVRYWRKGRRKEWRGTPTGRRATHAVETTWGRHQEARARAIEHSEWCAQRRELEVTRLCGPT
jgi:hypothetical protein